MKNSKQWPCNVSCYSLVFFILALLLLLVLTANSRAAPYRHNTDNTSSATSYCLKVLDLSVKYSNQAGYPQVRFTGLDGHGITWVQSAPGEYTLYAHAYLGKIRPSFSGFCMATEFGFIAGVNVMADNKTIFHTSTQSIHPCSAIFFNVGHALKRWQSQAKLIRPLGIDVRVYPNYDVNKTLGTSDVACAG